MTEIAVERRVDRLEIALENLARQVEETSRSVNQLSIEMQEFKNEMRHEMRVFRNEMRYEMRVFKDEMQTERRAFEEEMRVFKEEMRAFKEEMRNERHAFQREMNKRWGDLANRLGTLIEDIVAPAFPDVIKRRFSMEIEDMMVRRRRRQGELRDEFDLIADVGENVFVVEVKSRYRSKDVDTFSQKLDRFNRLFPEYKDKRIVGVIASLYLDESVIRYATNKRYYAMGMKGDYMDFLNAQEID